MWEKQNDEIFLKLPDAQWSSATIKCEKNFLVQGRASQDNQNEVAKMFKQQ